MSLVIISPDRNTSEWVNGIRAVDPTIDVQVWPEVKSKEKVIGAVVWNHPSGSLLDFSNLKFIASMGAGVDHILKDPQLPAGVPITRIIDEALTQTMSRYLIMATLYHQRRIHKYLDDKKECIWDQASSPELETKVGILGMGILGTDVAKKLALLGFEVYGFSQSRKEVAGVTSFAGQKELTAFLEKVNVVICLLPLTTQTKGILNMALFKQMNKGTFLINAARGSHLVEEDLIPAIESGYLSGAFLDVYCREPLPKNHPFWKSQRVMMTPHIASITNPKAAIPQIVHNYKATQAGEPLLNIIDPRKEY